MKGGAHSSPPYRGRGILRNIKMKFKNKICLLLAVVLIIGCFAGCSAKHNVSVPTNEKPSTPVVSQPAAEPEYEDGGIYSEAVDAYVDIEPMEPYEPYEPENPIEWDTEEYDYQKENSFESVSSKPFATFAADVDTASYANFRRQVLNNETIRPDSVRVEEFVNYFRYDYPEPVGNEPFSVTTEIAPCPWNEKTQLLSVGMQAKKLDTREMPKSNLVFLIDVSGSMDEPNKLPLVQRSFITLIENLNENDVVSMVTYAAGENVILDGVTADNKQQIISSIEELEAYGSTQGDKAIQIAYDLAEKHFIEGGVNRVIMATDGDFNVGITSESELTRLVQKNAKKGVFLSVLGYGMGNYKDNKLESMADNGNGNYAYIDTIDEARKVLVNEAGGTLFTVAKDVKFQVEFNPNQIKGYRLIGYENRRMADSDFADDTKDGGEIGAGHQVTALFEIVPIDSDFEIPEVESKYGKKENQSGDYGDEICTVNIRYKEPDGDKSTLLSYPVKTNAFSETPSNNLKWQSAVAEVAMLLKESEYSGNATFDSARTLAKECAGDDFRDEFIYLIGKVH